MTKDAEYLAQVRQHLVHYKADVLGVQKHGTWGKTHSEYPHVLPPELFQTNIVPSIRKAFWESHSVKRWSLHRYFHHLSSSQALAFNIFYPLFPAVPRSFSETHKTLGLSPVATWSVDFEVDQSEGTSVDVLIASSDGPRLIIEVKYTETGFGHAPNDENHAKKLASIYRPLLAGRIAESCFDPTAFFVDYQLYRNLACIRAGTDDRVALILPRGREQLWKHASDWCARPELGTLKGRVSVIAVEEVIDALQKDTANDGAWPDYAREIGAKYLHTAE